MIEIWNISIYRALTRRDVSPLTSTIENWSQNNLSLGARVSIVSMTVNHGVTACFYTVASITTGKKNLNIYQHDKNSLKWQKPSSENNYLTSNLIILHVEGGAYDLYSSQPIGAIKKFCFHISGHVRHTCPKAQRFWKALLYLLWLNHSSLLLCQEIREFNLTWPFMHLFLSFCVHCSLWL